MSNIRIMATGFSISILISILTIVLQELAPSFSFLILLMVSFLSLLYGFWGIFEEEDHKSIK